MTGNGGINPLTDASTTPVEGAANSTDTALLERVAVGRHEGYDRVVFQFTNTLPGYKVEYVQPPLKEDGSGNPVEIKGNASWSFDGAGLGLRPEHGRGSDGLQGAEAHRRLGRGDLGRAGGRPDR